MERGTQSALNSRTPWKASEAGEWAIYTVGGVSTTVTTTIIKSNDRFSFLYGTQHSLTRFSLAVCLSPWKASSTKMGIFVLLTTG